MSLNTDDIAFQQLRDAFLLYDTVDTATSCVSPPSWAGYLRDIRTLPLDVLVEVCVPASLPDPFIESTQILSHLNPVDLLSLARSTRDFRTLLMSKDSAFIWSAARGNIIGLPPCPTFLSEPAYANLVFNPDCYVRNGKHVRQKTS